MTSRSEGLGRLKSAYGRTYAYDGASRLTTFNGQTYGYGDAGPYHAVDRIGGQDRFDYDANGNVVKRNKGLEGEQALVWDAQNRLSQVRNKSGDLVEQYWYGVEGARVKKTSGGTTTYTFFAHYEEEVTGTVTTAISHYSFGGLRFAVKRGAALHHLHGDHLGSTSLTTDTAGAATASRAYYAYGAERSSSGTLQTDRTFTGQKRDGTGLMYYNARYYDPALGTFVSPDSLVPDPGMVIDYNRFLYVRGNPMANRDPTGHFSERQLAKWFGENYRSVLPKGMLSLLQDAQFGDLLYASKIQSNSKLAMFVEMDDMLVLWNIDAKQPMSLLQSHFGEGDQYTIYRREGWDGRYSNALPPRNTNTNMLGSHETATYNIPFGDYDSGLPRNVEISGAWWLGPEYWVGSQQEFRQFLSPNLRTIVGDTLVAASGSIGAWKAAGSPNLAQVGRAIMGSNWGSLGTIKSLVAGAKVAGKGFARGVGGPSLALGLWGAYELAEYETVYEVNEYIDGTTVTHLRNILHGPQPE